MHDLAKRAVFRRRYRRDRAIARGLDERPGTARLRTVQASAGRSLTQRDSRNVLESVNVGWRCNEAEWRGYESVERDVPGSSWCDHPLPDLRGVRPWSDSVGTARAD